MTAPPPQSPTLPQAPALDGPHTLVLSSVDPSPTATSVIADRTGLPLGALSMVLLRLEAQGFVRGEGTWWERCDQ